MPGPLALPHVQSGKLRALAFIGNQRSKALPDVPTFAEAGFGDAQVMSWYTIAVRSGTPPEIVNRIHAAAMKAIASPETRDRLDKASCEIPEPRRRLVYGLRRNSLALFLGLGARRGQCGHCGHIRRVFGRNGD